MNTNRKRRNTRGFTLLELMTVIGLIGALALAGVVAYKGYREYADQTVAKKTVSTLNEAITQYKSITGSTDLNAATFADAVTALRTVTPKGSTVTVDILRDGIVAADYSPTLTWDNTTDIFGPAIP